MRIRSDIHSGNQRQDIGDWLKIAGVILNKEFNKAKPHLQTLWNTITDPKVLYWPFYRDGSSTGKTQ